MTEEEDQMNLMKEQLSMSEGPALAILDFGSDDLAAPGLEFEMEDAPSSLGSAVPHPPPAERYITGPKLRALPESVMDAVVEGVVTAVEQSRVLRMRLIDMEDRLFESIAQCEQSQGSIEALLLERAGLAAENARLVEQVRCSDTGTPVHAVASRSGAVEIKLLREAMTLLLRGRPDSDAGRIQACVDQIALLDLIAPDDGTAVMVRDLLSGADPRPVCDVLPFVRRQGRAEDVAADLVDDEQDA